MRIPLEANNCVRSGLLYLTGSARNGNPLPHFFANIPEARGLLSMIAEGDSAGREI
jgi:hypothetical protein